MNDGIKSTTHIRFDILKTVYDLSNGNAGRTQKIFPVQVDNCTFQDMHYHLQTLKDKDYVDFTPHLLLRIFQVTLTDAGVAIIKEFQEAFLSKDQDRDQRMLQTLALLK